MFHKFDFAPAKIYIKQKPPRPQRRPGATGAQPSRIPTGFRLPAQGCEQRATLGHRPTNLTNRNAVAAIPFVFAARGICHNPVGVGEDSIPFTQGSACVATLGYMPESRWDSPMDAIMAAVGARADSSFYIHPSSFPPA